MTKSYYPINLDVAGKKCVVVGGGIVAERKVKTLLSFGAKVEVFSPAGTAGLARLVKAGRIKWGRRRYQGRNLGRAALVIAATDDEGLNRTIAAQAQARRIPVNVVDAPGLCTFIAPSVIKRGPLVVSISTSGQAPALAKALRQKLAKIITPELGQLTRQLGKLRRAGRLQRA